MLYRKRNSDGSLGAIVRTPGEDEKLSPELLIAYDAIAEQFQMIMDQQRQIAELKAEVAALKGGV